MPRESDLVLLSGQPFKLMSDSTLPRGRRAWEWDYRETQEHDPGVTHTLRWKLSGPMGRSRVADAALLGTDWSELEHRFEQLLLPPVKRRTVTLSNVQTPVTHNPDADVTTTSWTSTGANFFSVTDDYDSPNDADYGSTATENAYLVLGLPSATDPQVDTGHKVRCRVVSPSANAVDVGYKLRLYDGATVVATSEEYTITQVKVEILDDWVHSTDALPTIAAPSAGTDRLLLLLMSSDADEDTVNQLTAMTAGGQSMTKHSLEAFDGDGVGERRVAAFTLNDSGIGSMSGQTFSPTWTTGTAPADGIKYAVAVLQNVNQTTPISDDGEDDGNNLSIPAMTVAVGDMAIVAGVNGYWISGSSWSIESGYTEVYDEFIGPGPDPGSYHTLSYKLITTAGTETPTSSLSPGSDPPRGTGLGLVIQSSEAGSDAAQNTEWEVSSAAIATISAYSDLRLGVAKTSPADASTLRVSAMQFEVPQVGVQDVSHMHVDRAQVFAARGNEMVQINPGDMSEVEVVSMPAVVRAMGVWQGKGYVGYGSTAVLDKRDTVSAGGDGDVYTGITAVNANAMGRGAGRFWVADENNGYQFAVNEISASSDLGPVTPIQPHDPAIDSTGIYAVGPYMVATHEEGASSFTQTAGGQQALLDLDAPSSDNGRVGATLDRWAYVGTEQGLFAIRPDQLIANAVGPGEGLHGLSYEGDVTGIPTAMAPFRGTLLVGYYDKDTDRSWILQGMFIPGETPESGALDWYNFVGPLDAVRINAIVVSTDRTQPTIVWSEDANIAYGQRGRGGRDPRDSAYEYEDDSVERFWYGSDFMGHPGMHKNIRYAILWADDVDATNKFQLSVSVDDGAYVAIGDAITTNGHKFLRPTDDNDVPLTSVNGHHFKPRIGWTGDNATTPAKLRGFLDIVYDERPDHVEEHRLMIQLGGAGRDAGTELDELRDYLKLHTTVSPIEVEFPQSTETKYAMPVALEQVTDYGGDSLQAAMLTLQLWDV